jgi:gamma-glutamylcyclotransferase (GGCT)/AIG2-like uncharacterized protein YtfP
LVRGEHYPALVPDNKGRVEGMGYFDVPEPAWERLDRFEGEMYERWPVEIELNNGVTLVAATYIVQSEFMGCVDQVDWEFADFLRNGKAIFQKQYKGYRSL